MKNRNKRIAIFFTGGLDSTYLVYSALKSQYTVDLIYFEIENNHYKTQVEKFIRNKIIEKLRDIEDFAQLLNVNDSHNVYNITTRSTLHMPQFPLFITTIGYLDLTKYDEIHLGYVMNDDAISFIPEIKKIYKTLIKLNYSEKPCAKLKFPLSKLSKEQLIKWLPNTLLQDVFYCESPRLVKKQSRVF